MKYRYIALLFLALAFTIPASIKTEYKDYSDIRVDLSMRVEPYADAAVLITWEPEGQSDVLGYEIERHNAEGEFISAGFVPTLRGTKTRKFQFIDHPELNGRQVYRLKKIRTDRSEVLSREIVYSFHVESGIRTIQAREAENAVKVVFQNVVPQEVSLVVLNAAGQRIASKLPQWFGQGEQSIAWDHTHVEQKIAAGTYILELHTDTGVSKTEVTLK